MLSHTYRFHGHGSLRFLYRNGSVARNRFVVLKYVENKQRSNSRVAVIVGKKVAKSAVKRNRMRRRVFEVVRNNWDDIPANYDFTLTLFSTEFLTMPHSELEATILGVLKQARLYNKTTVDAT